MDNNNNRQNTPKPEDVDDNQTIIVSMESNSSSSLDSATASIIRATNKAGAGVESVVPMKTKKTPITLNRSPHIYGLHKETYHQVLHRRILTVRGSKGFKVFAATKVPSNIYFALVNSSKRSIAKQRPIQK